MKDSRKAEGSDWETNARIARRGRGVGRKTVLILAGVLTVAGLIGGAYASSVLNQTSVQTGLGAYGASFVGTTVFPTAPTLAPTTTPTGTPDCLDSGTNTPASPSPTFYLTVNDTNSGLASACPVGGFDLEWAISSESTFPATQSDTFTFSASWTGGGSNYSGTATFVVSQTSGSFTQQWKPTFVISFGQAILPTSVTSFSLVVSGT